MSYLVGENLIGGYGAGDILKGCTISAEKGEISVVVGPNGAGKSTAMKALLGMLRELKGQVLLEGEDITRLSPQQRVSRGMAFVPQTQNVFVSLSVEENLVMGAYIRRDKAAVRQDIEMVYDYFPILKERRSQAAGTLSGGQQQMLAIGRGLMSRPSLMLLDEPSLGLSPLLVQEIFEIIRRLNKEQGVTLLLVEQNAQVALNTADHGYVLETGRIVMDGSADDLLASDDIREFYLGQSAGDDRPEKRWKRKKTWR